MRIFIISVLALFLLTGCVVSIPLGMSDTIIYGTGEINTHTYSVGSFSDIEIRGDFEIIYRNGTSDTVTIEMQNNLYEYVEVWVSGRTLVIESFEKLRTASDKYPKVLITAPELSGIVSHGIVILTDADNIVTDDLFIRLRGVGDIALIIEAENVDVNLSGAGSVRLSGKADTAKITMSGAGSIDAIDLQTRETTANISGAGGGSISCSERLNVTISGVGSFSYRGEPEITSNISGVGSLRKLY
jgi:hypothetical protein